MKIFVSSLIVGHEALRDVAASAIVTLGHEAVRAEDFGASPESAQVACLAEVREADVMIAMIAGFEAVLPTGLRLSVKNVIAGGDHVAVEAEGDGVTAAGVPYRNQYCFVFTLADGKVKQLNEYFCTVHADEVLWPLIAAGAS